MTVRNPYAPPSAPVRTDGAGDAPPFFVVSPTKLVVLYVATLGMYPLYWFYMHWARHRVGRAETIWPLARAVFAPFYVHALARRIDRQLRTTGAVLRWWPLTIASLYVVFEALNWGSALAWPWLSPRLPAGAWWLEWLGVLVMPLSCACLVRLQRAANVACGDPRAETNRRFTVFNLAWIVFGITAFGWAAYGAGLVGPPPG